MSDPSRAKEIFLDALEEPAEARANFVRAACGTDQALRARVEGLLAAHAGSRTRSVAGGQTPTLSVERMAASALADLEARIGDRIGPYRLIGHLGEGGFGHVFLAEQTEPVKRRVALKIVKLGMDSRQVVARFELERQTLALMDHPHIARVFDAGATNEGRPYFVIEYVPGLPITEYCRAHDLDLDQRVELMRLVCLAIQHAHSKGVLHRDIKPTNILVTDVDGVLQPRVIDFGVAKAIGDDPAGDVSLITNEGQLVGTPTYMSPEQIRGSADIDTRSDVHALGVVLYELLVGRTPFVPTGQGSSALFELAQQIRERDPVAPSLVRVGEGGVAANRPVELDWVILRCLEKERDRRYPTAAALAADLAHFLADEPVEAAPPSRLYRLRKLVRRNRGLALAIAAAIAALLLGMLGTAIGLVRAGRANDELDASLRRERQANEGLDGALRREREANAELDGALEAADLANAALREARARAEREAESVRRQVAVADAVNRFLTEDLLASVRPSSEAGRGRDVSMIDVVDRAAVEIETAGQPGGRFADKPLVEVRLRFTLGSTYRALGRNQEALAHLERAIELGARTIGADDPGVLECGSLAARALTDLGRSDEAEARLVELLPRLQRVRGSDDSVTIMAGVDLGMAMRGSGRLEEAARQLRQTLDAARATVGDESPKLLGPMEALAIVEFECRRPHEAGPLFERVAAIRTELYGPEDPLTVLANQHLGTFLTGERRFDEAQDVLATCLEQQQRMSGPFHPNTNAAAHNLALVLVEIDELQRAAELIQPRRDHLMATFGPTHADTLSMRELLALISERDGRLEEAYDAFVALHADSLRAFEPGHPATVLRLVNRSRVQFALGERDAALTALLDEWVNLVDPATRRILARGIYRLYERLGDEDEAAVWRGRASG